MNRRVEIFAWRGGWKPQIDIQYREVFDDGRIAVLEPAAVSVKTEDQANSEMARPFLTISMDTAKQLMDELWRCGIRPSSEVGSVGEKAALENHLGDMRKVAAGLLKKHGVDL